MHHGWPSGLWKWYKKSNHEDPCLYFIHLEDEKGNFHGKKFLDKGDIAVGEFDRSKNQLNGFIWTKNEDGKYHKKDG